MISIALYKSFCANNKLVPVEVEVVPADNRWSAVKFDETARNLSPLKDAGSSEKKIEF
jgi:hypothetical protein